nr:hypothetical protein [uncultured bacterium]
MGERGRELLERLDTLQRVANTVAAMQVRVLAEFAAVDRDELDPAGEFTHLEVAAVLRSSQPYARARLEFAQALTTRLPATLQALQEGKIDEYKARRMVDATEILTDDQATQVENQLIPHAEDWTPQQLNSRLRRAVIRADPDAAAKRAEAKRAARHLRHDVLDDGAGLLQIHGDVERTSLAYQRIHTIARHLKTTGDDRTMDQIAADVALDLMAGKNFQHAKVHVWLTLPATTALGVDEQPGHLAGYGYLPAQRALELAAQEDTTWQRVLTDPATGHVLDVGRHKYRPPAALRDHLRLRYPTCTGPGCRQPAHRCDQDHLVPFPTGPTNQDNLRPLCRPHHRAKTHGGWRAVTTNHQEADKIELVWITKNGFRFPYEPEPITDPGEYSRRAG